MPLVYVITDRRLLSPPAKIQEQTFLIEFAQRAFAAGVDILQIREPDLSARDQLSVAENIAALAYKSGAGVLINDRADIAVCAAAGVHLTTRSLSAEVVRGLFSPDLVIGVSTHSFEEAKAAESGGADFIVFGPVFETASKKQYGEPVGIEALRRVAASLSIPVLALGGIKPTNFFEALNAGAQGIAGISMFAEAPDLNSLVATIKSHVAA
ncbi:MAG: thiamine phosphate synthase [Acidobacteria bacterium]|nr:MAG: thiamine phosphate synthase [Acidobacteriota bacterium]